MLQVRNSNNLAYVTVPDATVTMTLGPFTPGTVNRTDALSLHFVILLAVVLAPYLKYLFHQLCNEFL